jgi:hypothetical protein
MLDLENAIVVAVVTPADRRPPEVWTRRGP